MSITLDKLRALKRQAGDTQPPSRPARPDLPLAGAGPAPVHPTVRADGSRADAAASGQDAGMHAGVPDAGGRARFRADAGNCARATAPLPPASPGAVPGGPTAGSGNDAGAPGTTPTRSVDPGPRGDASAAPLHTLRRLLGVRERRPPGSPSPRAPLDRSLPGTEIAPGLYRIETRLPFAAPVAALPLAFARRDTSVDPRALLFFDTETTGLAGGTGTRAFMIGAADWVDDTLRVRQLLISTMAAEPAMLREFAGWLSPGTVLASYNGRSYDAPLLKTRYRLARLPDPLQALDHLDLLHPTRRRYRGRWENCRLATVERELLRIVREDDLPGAQAPMAWLGFLRGGGSALLHRVAAHNHQDVVTLARLLLRLVEAESAGR